MNRMIITKPFEGAMSTLAKSLQLFASRECAVSVLNVWSVCCYLAVYEPYCNISLCDKHHVAV